MDDGGREAMTCRARIGLAAVGFAFIAALSAPATAATRVGETAPNFTLPEWTSGSPVSLYDFSGKIVLLDFFAYWCPHCQATKKQFAESFQFVDYVECAIPNSENQAPACDAAKITGYPTWTFSDGSREEGEVTFFTLAKKTGCSLY
jgi:thiol-disulfide isomerase/thioredoxin